MVATSMDASGFGSRTWTICSKIRQGSMPCAMMCGSAAPSPTSAPVVTTAVTIGDDFFDPANIQVSPGATVTWTWSSDVRVHNVTFSDVTSGDKNPASTFAKSFPTAVTFTYHCTLHPGMSGA